MIEYTLVPAGKGFEASSQSDRYSIAMQWFSLAATALDERGNAVASMHRSSWWRLNYRIETKNERYAFSSSAFNDTLLAKNANTTYLSHGSIEFYDSNGNRVTELSRNQSPPGSLNLKIHVVDHQLALILVSCLYYKTVMAAPGHAV